MNRFNKFDISRIEYQPEYLVAPVLPSMPKTREKVSKKAIIPFVLVLMILTSAFQGLLYLSSARSAQGQILGAATSAYGDLSSAGDSLRNQNFTDAQGLFNSALSNLNTAQQQLDNFKALETVVPQAKSAEHLLHGASLLANAGGRLSAALAIFNELKVSSTGVTTDNIIDKLAQNRDSINSSLDLLEQAEIEFDAVGDLPAQYASTMDTAKQQVSLLTVTLRNLTNLEDLFLGFFGQGMKTYLLVFENPDEVRATGGFIGTYGVVKVDSGKIQNLKIESIYNLDGKIYDQIAAPGPFQPAVKKWGIRDANWFVDFPQSAKKLLYFYDLAGETADGVLALTPNLFENLLELTGPIDMPNYGVTLTATNFQDVIQYETSVAYDHKQNQPKKMLSDFAPVLLNRLSSLDQQQWLQLLQILQTNLNQKQILLYSHDADLQQKIANLKLAGEVLPADQDYLNIVNTNLGGTKTDLKLKQSANLASKILSDGTVINTLTVTRSNTSLDLNRDYMRLLVPLGSTLISSKGFDSSGFNKSESEGFRTDPDLAAWDQGEEVGSVFVRTEADKTEFAGWIETDPSKERVVTLTYSIPYRASTNLWVNHVPYSLLFQKQDGTTGIDLTVTVDAGALSPFWTSSDVETEANQLKFKYTTGSDQYWAVLLSK